MALKKFNATHTQILNGVDTYAFSMVCASTGIASKYVEGATVAIKSFEGLAFAGSIKKTDTMRSGYVREVLAESPVSIIRDLDVCEASARGLTRLSDLLVELCPPQITIKFLSSEDPAIRYAFRSGSIITHLNTLCSMCGMNWRSRVLSATSAEIVISKVEPTKDTPELVENVDIFNLKIDKSLFKKYTQVTAVGVEPEVAGYTCTASLTSATYFILDSDDGEIGLSEIPPPGHIYEYLYPIVAQSRIDLQWGANLKGWDVNAHALINGEIISYTSKSGTSLFGVQRAQYNMPSNKTHIIGDDCMLVDQINLVVPTGQSGAINPATTLFKIGSEIVQGNISGTALELATIAPNSMFYIGRGLEYSETASAYIYNQNNAYSHKCGSVVMPYYESARPPEDVVAVTIHGKGIINKDGIDKLAWGALLNVQNGILSGSCTYKAGDFFDGSIAVGTNVQITTATTRTGPASVITPATTYDCIIYSITKKQNSLMQIEFGNVIPEIMNLLKSGEYAMQAAIRKTKPIKETKITDVSPTGTTAVMSSGDIVKIRW